MTQTSNHVLLRYKVKKDEMGGVCGVFGGEEKCIQGSSEETQIKETDCKA